ncbi:MAG: hypothetical protein NTU91_08460 [Chloroflexi bacterium]|nr:hypothetical protein [Chloroflexota bacterium]
MKTRSQTHWLIDAVLFLGLIAAFFPDVTGVEQHQRIGIFGGALAVLHLALHWEWESAVTSRFFGRTSNTSRLYLLIDGGIMLGFLAMVGTGLVISTWLGLTLSNFGGWLTLHIIASIGTLLLVLTKVTLHWRWIASVGRKVLEPAPSLPSAAAPKGAVSRREFLGVMGVAGFGAAVALTSGASGLLSQLFSETEASPEESPETSSASAESAASSTGTNAYSSIDNSTASSSRSGVAQSVESPAQSSVQVVSEDSAACSVACRRGCSFPGHCRRYTDSNGNGRCDWGECM